MEKRQQSELTLKTTQNKTTTEYYAALRNKIIGSRKGLLRLLGHLFFRRKEK